MSNIQLSPEIKTGTGVMNIKFSFLLFVLVIFSVSAIGQVRPVQTRNTSVAKVPDRTMQETIEAKYLGGLFGVSKKQHGTIKFDDINERLVFISKKEGKEVFSIPYTAIAVVYPSTKKVRSGTGRAVGAIPVPGAGIGGLFMKKKKNYLIVNYDDADVKVTGAINFLVDTTEILHNSIYTIGEKAEMKPRGDAYVRRSEY